MIPSFQFGFRRRLTCTDNIASLISNIKVANNKKQVTGVIFLDIEGAFDNVILPLLPLLLKMLQTMGFPNKIVNFIDSVISTRHLSSYMSSSFIQSRSTNIGLPQGSVLSPLLFNIYLSQIESCLLLLVMVLMYVDDIVIFCSHSSLVYIANQLNLVLTNLGSFLKDLGLSLSLSSNKSSYSFFSLNNIHNIKTLI